MNTRDTYSLLGLLTPSAIASLADLDTLIKVCIGAVTLFILALKLRREWKRRNHK